MVVVEKVVMVKVVMVRMMGKMDIMEEMEMRKWVDGDEYVKSLPASYLIGISI